MNLPILTPDTTPRPTRRPVLEGIAADLGFVPNLAATAAASPALLAGFDGMRRAVAATGLDPVLREVTGPRGRCCGRQPLRRRLPLHDPRPASGVAEPDIDAIRDGRPPGPTAAVAAYTRSPARSSSSGARSPTTRSPPPRRGPRRRGDPRDRARERVRLPRRRHRQPRRPRRARRLTRTAAMGEPAGVSRRLAGRRTAAVEAHLRWRSPPRPTDWRGRRSAHRRRADRAFVRQRVVHRRRPVPPRIRAVILRRRLDDALAGRAMPDDWLLRCGTSGTPSRRERRPSTPWPPTPRRSPGSRRSRSRSGPLWRGVTRAAQLDATGFVGLRLNEHVLHTWDVAVALDPAATLPPDATALCVDNLGLIARYTAKPDGTQRTVTVGTTDPMRSFAITLTPDTVVSFAPAPGSGEPTSSYRPKPSSGSSTDAWTHDTRPPGSVARRRSTSFAALPRSVGSWREAGATRDPTATSPRRGSDTPGSQRQRPPVRDGRADVSEEEHQQPRRGEGRHEEDNDQEQEAFQHGLNGRPAPSHQRGTPGIQAPLKSPAGAW